jgi:hypothetical protein
MGEQDTPQPVLAGLNKGLRLVAEYRLARLADGPARRAALQENRRQLREDRRRRRQGDQTPHASIDTPEAGPSHDHPAQPAEHRQEHPASIFAAICEDANVGQAALESPPDTPRDDAAPCAQEDMQNDLNDNACHTGDTGTPEQAQPQQDPMSQPEPDSHVALSEIGFGPGMILRLGQIGIETADALANADPSQLRLSLGDASTLINVDAWIANAREATRRRA